ncbi:uncharacterized protein LOC143263929 [Megachile rotundata]|uniref:uncharacterized protein LOC143263929 n=1 Tax=Megachile rotundata TaxID=143995 RepID=UPI003FD0CA88
MPHTETENITRGTYFNSFSIQLNRVVTMRMFTHSSQTEVIFVFSFFVKVTIDCNVLIRSLVILLIDCGYSVFQNEQVEATGVFDLYYYKPLKKYLVSLGLNPYVESVGSNVKHTVVVCTIISGLIVLCLQLIVVIKAKDVDKIIDQIPDILLMITSLIKYENVVLHKKRFQVLLNSILNDWKQWTNELPVLEKTTSQAGKIARSYRNTLAGATIYCIYSPLMNPTLDLIIPLNETRPKEFLFKASYAFIEVDDHFISVFLHLSWIAIVTVYCIAIVDSLYILIIHHVCGLFDVCGYQIETATQDPELRYDQFKQCVMTHHKALMLFDNLQECSKNMFLVLVAINMTLISMTGVQILMAVGKPHEMLRFSLFFLCEHIHLYIISLFGQIILNHSAILAERIYSSDWYEIPIKFQKLLCIMILRCSKPVNLNAGGLYDMNMENYGKVLKACMSYFTMFVSMTE